MFSKLKSNILFKSIGKVKNDFQEDQSGKYPAKALSMISTLVINRRLSAALEGIESYSHLIVIYHLHKTRGTKGLKIHPQGRKEIARIGLFATRSPYRPNPIGVTIVKLLKRHFNSLEVRGLDALSGTPILDIKPYTHADMKRRIHVPEWILTLKKSKITNC